ncbi:MAG: hypothetical protein WCY09_10260 [Candidatus Omnitrophota bacterium]|jgi:hypothetical protein
MTLNFHTTIEERASEALIRIVSLAGDIVSRSLPETSERLAGLEFIVGSYTPLVLEILADTEHPGKLIFKFPELRSSRSQTLAPFADWVQVDGEHLEFTELIPISEIASVLSMRYHYLVMTEKNDRDNEAALNDPMMAVRVLQRDFPDFADHIQLVPGHGLSFIIDGYSYVNLRKILASLTWIQV